MFLLIQRAHASFVVTYHSPFHLGAAAQDAAERASPTARLVPAGCGLLRRVHISLFDASPNVSF